MDTNRGFRWLVVCGCVALMAGCGGLGGDDSEGLESGDFESGDCSGGGWCGSEAIGVEADLSGAKALFTLQDSGSSVVANTAAKALISTQSKFYKLMSNGTYEAVLSALNQDGTDATGDLPLISFIALNDKGDAFVAYEHPFMYRTPDANYKDPWSPSSPYTCQMFRVKSTVREFAQQGSSADGNLCCITNTLELNTWDSRSNKIQFDSTGNAYFTAHVPQNWKNVMIKWDRSSTPTVGDDGSCTYPSSALSEIINANILFRDYLVVPTGGVFYTGITSTNGDFHGDSDSFLRFRADSGNLQEITSGWWDYIFQPVGVDDTLLGVDAGISLAVSTSERVLFYGPDPLVATSPGWDDSCLFLYNPNESGTARSTEIADCQIDVWNYVSWNNPLATQKTRCAETKYMMGGGNQPKKILTSDSYDENGVYIKGDGYDTADGKKEIFTVGDVYYKKEGEWRYDICVDEAHCTVSNIPSYTYNGNQVGCESNAGTWQTTNKCYNQLSNAALLTSVTAVGADETWRVNGQWCETPGGDWRSIYSGFARVNYTDADTRSVSLLSSTNEVVKNGWVVNDRLFYVSFNSTDGQYYLMEVGNSTAILSGYEVYELFKDPNDSAKLYFNGLRFSDNSYVMGTLDPDNAGDTLSVDTGITGQVETIIVIPDSLLQ